MSVLDFFRRPFKRPPPPRASPWDPAAEILSFDSGDAVTLRDLYSGTQIFGSTGSGKTSGSMAALCKGLFAVGAGALCLCAKRDDSVLYRRYARECGREKDVMLFGPESGLFYNFIDSELSQGGSGPGLVTNLTALLSAVGDLGDGGKGGSGSGDNVYFQKASDQLCRNSLEVLVQANGRVTIPDLQRFVSTTPNSLDEVASRDWQASSYFFQSLRRAEKVLKSECQRKDYELAVTYFMNEWAPMSGRTRSSILSMLTSSLDLLSRGAARDLLSSPTSNVSPEMCWEGAIVIVDIPALVYHDIARLIGVIMKFCWQRAAMRRDLSKGDRPMAIISDESHLFAAKPDWEFQAVARGTNTATIYSTQSISNYLEVFGHNSDARVHSLLGNLQNQFFHQLTDTKTVSYVQELIGKRRQTLFNGNISNSGGWMDAILPGSDRQSVSGGFGESFDHELQARDLNSLPKGGPAQDWKVGAILYQGGKTFRATGRTWMRVGIDQSR